MYYTIKSSDVEQPLIRAFGRSWLAQNFIGRIMKMDVGKRVYRHGDVLQVESQEQLEARLQSK